MRSGTSVGSDGRDNEELRMIWRTGALVRGDEQLSVVRLGLKESNKKEDANDKADKKDDMR
eukprot:CAMPEP_0184657090 /NCGR_PEP_ID=MMETSP0308-20130426/16972_1 /TAXON_ID=38269 /ORGANISM="Gloeochaete witrockiana, Strain SAG 46.84" /LENGTH=60 /DNA_ID=CAMNT_0027094497 /DNA_START=193 /DNA_END=375 /DNA_ORIENTATION=-